MGIFLLKNAIKKPLLNSRYVFRNFSSIEFNPSLYIPKRHMQLDNTNYLLEKKLPLVRRLYGNNNDDGGDNMHYFSLLSTKDLSPVKQLHLPFPKIEVVGSCNGVLCLEDEETEGRTALWNPSTNDFKFLPHTCIQRHLSAVFISFSCSGFGFDRNSQDYKVVRFVDNVFETEKGDYYHHTEHHVELYSLKFDSWKEIIPYTPDVLPVGPSAYVNGVFYWVAASKKSVDQILSFDFANQEFSSFGFPESGKRMGPYTLILVAWDGSLTAVIYSRYGTEKSFELWVRNDGESSWVRVSAFPVSGAVRPLGFWTKDQLLFEGMHYNLSLFDLATRESKHLHIYDYPEVLEFIPCEESSVQLNEKSEFENKEPSKGEAVDEQDHTVS